MRIEVLFRDLLKTEPDCNRLLIWARKNRITPLLYWLIKNDGFSDQYPEWFFNILKNDYCQSQIRNLILCAEAEALLRQFNLMLIPVIPLKGIVLSNLLYPDSSLRPYADIDFLIYKKDDLSWIGRMFNNMGYTRLPGLRRGFEEKFTSCVSFIKETKHWPIVVEVHWHILYFPTYGPRINIREFWGNIEWFEINSMCVPIFRPEYQLIHLCLHYYLHAASYLIWLVDIALLIERYQDEIDWERFFSAVRRFKIEKPIQKTLNDLRTTFKLAIPEDSGKKCIWSIDARAIALEALSKNPRNSGLASLLNLFFIPSITDKINFFLATICPSSDSSRGKNKRLIFMKFLGALKEIIKFVLIKAHLNFAFQDHNI